MTGFGRRHLSFFEVLFLILGGVLIVFLGDNFPLLEGSVIGSDLLIKIDEWVVIRRSIGHVFTIEFNLCHVSLQNLAIIQAVAALVLQIVGI